MKHLPTGLLLLLWLVVASSHAAVTNTIPCDYLSISNACRTAGEGDTVLILPGSCVISNRITIDRTNSFHIRGSGTNETFLYSNSGITAVFGVQSTSTNTFYISDLTCMGTVSNTEGFLLLGKLTTSGPATLGLINVYNVRMPNILRYGIQTGRNSPVLIDHCYFETRPGAVSYNAVRVFGAVYDAWLDMPDYAVHDSGTVVEDCVFVNNSGDVGNGFFDGYNGSRSWYRYNIFNGDSATGNHGYDSQITSAQTLFVHNNIFTNTGTHLCGTRGGLYHFYSNTVYSIYPSSQPGNKVQPKMFYYRAILIPSTAGVQASKGHVGSTLFKTWSLSSNFVGGNTISVGSIQYTMRTAANLISSPNLTDSIAIGADMKESVTNIAYAVNGNGTTGVNYSRGATNAFPLGTVPCLDMYGVVSNDTDFAYLVLTNRLDGMTPIAPYSRGNPAAFMHGAVRLLAMYTNQWVIQPNAQWANRFFFSNGVESTIEWERGFQTFTNIPNDTVNTIVENVYYTNGVAQDYTSLPYPQNPRSGTVTNTPPTISQIANQTIPHSTSTGPLAFTVGDAEDGPAGLVPVGDSSDTNLVPVANIVFGGSGASRTVDITPTAGIGGEATISISITDSGGLLTTMQFTLTVTPPVINTPPTLSQIDDQIAYKSTTIGPLAFLADDAQVGGSLTLVAWSNNQALIPDTGLLIGGEGTNRNLTILPTENWSGVARVYYSASDGVFTVTNNFLVTYVPDGTAPAFARRIRR